METMYLVFDDANGGLFKLFGAYGTLELASSAAAEITGVVVQVPVLEDHR